MAATLFSFRSTSPLWVAIGGNLRPPPTSSNARHRLTTARRAVPFKAWSGRPPSLPCLLSEAKSTSPVLYGSASRQKLTTGIEKDGTLCASSCVARVHTKASSSVDGTIVQMMWPFSVHNRTCIYSDTRQCPPLPRTREFPDNVLASAYA